MPAIKAVAVVFGISGVLTMIMDSGVPIIIGILISVLLIIIYATDRRSKNSTSSSGSNKIYESDLCDSCARMRPQWSMPWPTIGEYIGAMRCRTSNPNDVNYMRPYDCITILTHLRNNNGCANCIKMFERFL